MTDAPETIFVNTDDIEDGCCPVEEDEFGDRRFYSHETATKYRRADLVAPATPPMPPTPEQIMADPRVKALVEALNVIAERPTHEGGCYYNDRLSVFGARAALAQLKEPKE